MLISDPMQSWVWTEKGYLYSVHFEKCLEYHRPDGRVALFDHKDLRLQECDDTINR